MITNARDWLVIAGGPGVSSNYLYCLEDIFEQDNLIFYNQIGTYDCPLIFESLEQMIDQIHTVVMESGLTSFGVITHSFGNFLLMEYIKKYGSKDINSLIMIGPCPLFYQEWKDSLEQLISSMPKQLLDDYVEMKQTTKDGSDLFRLIYPYYTYVNNDLDIEVKFNADSCEEISSSVVKFNHSEVMRSLMCPLFVIAGQYDLFIKKTSFQGCTVFNIPNTGHYPHLEDGESFKAVVRKIAGDLCRMTARKYI